MVTRDAHIINPPCMRRRVTVVVRVCVSVKSNLTSGASVRPENPVMYSVDNGGQKNYGVFSETAQFAEIQHSLH